MTVPQKPTTAVNPFSKKRKAEEMTNESRPSVIEKESSAAQSASNPVADQEMAEADNDVVMASAPEESKKDTQNGEEKKIDEQINNIEDEWKRLKL
jgi:hypothetical protein